ncbi:MAG: amidohydrolase family protein [Bryobacteraceae bacterium]
MRTHLLIGLSMLLGCSTPPPPSTAIAITGVTLIDGTGTAPVAGASIVVDQGRIVAAGPAASVTIPAGASRVDAAGQFAIPGLMDMHVHLGSTGGPGFYPENYTRERVLANLNSYLRYGVTTVRSVGTEREAGMSIRDEQRTGRLTTARLFTAGRGFTAPGGHPSQEIGEIARQPRDAAAARAEVAELAAQKVDLIKIWIDEGPDRPKIARPVIEAIADEAKKYSIPVVAHIRFEDDVRHLLDAGGAGFLHMIRDNDEPDTKLVEALKARAIVFTPTLIRQELGWLYKNDPKRLDDPEVARLLNPATLRAMREAAAKQPAPTAQAKLEFERALANTRKLANAGIPIAVGSDGGSQMDLPGLMTLRECELLAQAGFSPMEVITAATLHGAMALGRQKELGTIREGRRADILLLAADPAIDVKNLRAVNRIMLDGAWVDRDGLRLQ